MSYAPDVSRQSEYSAHACYPVNCTGLGRVYDCSLLFDKVIAYKESKDNGVGIEPSALDLPKPELKSRASG